MDSYSQLMDLGKMMPPGSFKISKVEILVIKSMLFITLS